MNVMTKSSAARVTQIWIRKRNIIVAWLDYLERRLGDAFEGPVNLDWEDISSISPTTRSILYLGSHFHLSFLVASCDM